MQSDPFSLLPVQVLPPGSDPQSVTAVLETLGYQDGGPEANGYRFDLYGWKPRIWLCAEREEGVLWLDLGLTDPGERARIGARLPAVGRSALKQALESGQEGRVLWALAAVELLEDETLLPMVELCFGRGGETGDRAARVIARLAQEARARQTALLSSAAMGAELRPLLLSIATGECPMSLRPGIMDAMSIFDIDVAGAMAIEVSRLWETRPQVSAVERGTELDVFVSPAGLFRGPNALSSAFPQGYREIAGWLVPERSWVCWRYRSPGASRGVLYDGLVRMEGRWVWIPKPWRMMSAAVATAGDIKRRR